jgi:hypothetical protein
MFVVRVHDHELNVSLETQARDYNCTCFSQIKSIKYFLYENTGVIKNK